MSEPQINFKDSKYSTGRRKKSIAKIWLKKGSGKISINGKNYEDYFKRSNHKMQILRPFEIIDGLAPAEITKSRFEIKLVAPSISSF